MRDFNVKLKFIKFFVLPKMLKSECFEPLFYDSTFILYQFWGTHWSMTISERLFLFLGNLISAFKNIFLNIFLKIHHFYHFHDRIDQQMIFFKIKILWKEQKLSSKWSTSIENIRIVNFETAPMSPSRDFFTIMSKCDNTLRQSK